MNQLKIGNLTIQVPIIQGGMGVGVSLSGLAVAVAATAGARGVIEFEALGADDGQVHRETAAWIEQWPTWAAHGLIVTGSAGSGKTHAMKVWLAKSGGKLISSPELLSTPIADWKGSVAIDDADALAGDARAEEQLFHLHNQVQATHGFFLLTMTRGAGLAGFVLPDLRSRLLALPSTLLNPPDDALLEALIVKQFRDRQIDLDFDVVSYLAARVTRDAASIRATVENLDHASLAQGRKITIALARAVLEAEHE